QFYGKFAALSRPEAYQQLVRQAAGQKWVVYAKRPFGGPGQVLTYLSRYTHRVALSPRRLLALDPHTQKVTFAWKDSADGSKRKTMCLEVKEFMRRFCLHLLPARFVKIRHFGFLSNRQRKLRVAKDRALLDHIRPACPSAVSLEPLRVCPYCGSCFLLLV